jgi:gamma-glutamylcyclotransferase (GGCT)/AIG2-like uncharacterized protein YtfP
MSNSAYIFVYGTLRRNASNAQRMSSARFLFEARVKGALYRVDWYPGFTFNGETDVTGEVYEVSQETLSELDEYEGEEYKRSLIEMNSPSSGALNVWVYEFIKDTKNLQRIPNGNWLEVERGLL